MQNNHSIKTMVRGLYDIQKLRVQMGNRIVANFKAKELGQTAGKPEEELGGEEKRILTLLRDRFKKITDGVKAFPTKGKFKPDEVISSYSELCLLRSYISLETEEHTMTLQLKHALNEFPIYTEFLENVRGCGSLMSGVIISEIDISAAKYSSSLWKYAGLDVAQDGNGRSRKKEHLVESTYINKDGDEMKKMGITFNPFLKTKLVGVLGASFLKSKSPYADIYYDYKNRLENHPKHKEKTKGHRHNMAIRYCIKMFLIDLYANWRELEGLPVAAPYSEAKLGLVHHGGGQGQIPLHEKNKYLGGFDTLEEAVAARKSAEIVDGLHEK